MWRFGRRKWAWSGLLLVWAGLAGCNTAGTAGTAASAEVAKEYIKKLGLTEFDMKATESLGGQQLVEITGKITNHGDRKIRQVELNCVFTDPYGQPVLREKVAIVRADRGGLAAGETKPYRLAFDTIPNTWNEAPPHMVMAGVVFD
ncbi:MAG: FxLYD domain-containing protein [Bryobacter sp.]|nr:FxLYD domain-containing protein [Bryobacter sp.]